MNTKNKQYSICRHTLTIFCFLLLITSISCRISASNETDVAIQNTSSTKTKSNIFVDKEFRYLNMAMDRYNEKFYLYTEADSGGNHWYPAFIFNNSINGPHTASVDTEYRNNPHSGKTCIHINFTGEAGTDGTHGNAVRFQDCATWNGKDVNDNSGDPQTGLGYDLTGATFITGWIRSNQPDRQVWLYIGYQSDSLQKLPVIQPDLTTDWQQFKIDLTGLNLSKLSCGLTVAYVADDEKVEPCDIFLDDIEFDKTRSDSLRFIPSYEPHITRDDLANRNACHIYDNACSVIAYLARGTEDDNKRARLLANTLVYCISSKNNEAPLCNAYMSGDIPLHPKELPRLPGWWIYEPSTQAYKWYQDRYHVSSNTGNIAWVILALVDCYEKTKDDKSDPDRENEAIKYRDAAVQLGRWVVKYCKDKDRPIGFTGGVDGFPGSDKKAPIRQSPAMYKSTEHNIDLVAAFARLYLITKDAYWREQACSAHSFVNSMYIGDLDKTNPNKNEPRFVTGTNPPNSDNYPHQDKPDDDRNLTPKPLDVNTWSMLVLGPTPQTKDALNWALNNCFVDGPAGNGFKGYAFKAGAASNIDITHFKDCNCPDINSIIKDRDSIWFEGTGQAVCAMLMDDQTVKAIEILQQMEAAQINAPGGNGLGLVAASHDCLVTGFELEAIQNNKSVKIPWVYYSQVSLAASCWHIFAELHYNPYWGKPISAGVPNWDK